MSTAKRLDRIEYAIKNRNRHRVFGWCHTHETGDQAIDRMIAEGRITEKQRGMVVLARWLRPHEAVGRAIIEANPASPAPALGFLGL
jgi:hypothetical protein